MRGAGQCGGDLELQAPIVFGLLAVAAKVPGEEDRIGLARLGHQADHALEVEDVFLARTGDVDGIAGRGRRRKDAGERCAQTVAESVDQQAAGDQAIGGERDVPSTIPGDPDPAASWLVWCQQHLEEIDHLLRGLHPIHPTGEACRVDSDRIADQGSGM